MNEEEALFLHLVDTLSSANADVALGKMMSASGLKYKGKVFAFYYKDGMVFRLGKQFVPEQHGILHAQPFNPYKTKGPVPGWFVLDKTEKQLWKELAVRALEFTQTL